MWPWGHLAVAYLLYTGYTHRRYGRAPRAKPVLVLAVASQFPDLVDKPLGWGLGVFAGGRALAHSLLFATALISVAYTVATYTKRVEIVTAFVLGHLSHVLADVRPETFAGDLRGAHHLFWPVLHWSRIDDPFVFDAPGVVETALAPFIHPVGYSILQVALVLAAAVRWNRDGRPGLEVVSSTVSRFASVGR